MCNPYRVTRSGAPLPHWLHFKCPRLACFERPPRVYVSPPGSRPAKAPSSASVGQAWIFVGYSLPAADYDFKYLLKKVQLSRPKLPDLVPITGGNDADSTYRNHQKFFGRGIKSKDELVLRSGADRRRSRSSRHSWRSKDEAVTVLALLSRGTAYGLALQFIVHLAERLVLTRALPVPPMSEVGLGTPIRCLLRSEQDPLRSRPS